MSALTYILIVTFLVCGSLAERISNVESPTWSRRTTEGYGFSAGSVSSGRDRSPSFDGDVEVRPYAGSSYPYGTTDSPRRFTYSWENTDASVTRSSYLDRFTTQRPIGSASGSAYDRDSYGYAGSRRPSYQTDRWGDPVGGERTTPRSPYQSDYTTDRWSLSGGSGRDRTSAWGSGGSRTTSRYGSDSDNIWGSSGSSSRDSFDPNNAYLRIQAELVKLTNEKGITSTGSKCDTFGACDTMCYGYLDTERPNAEFPGSRDTKYWPKLFETDDNNSPTFSNANVTRDVCGLPYREATFRVYCEDRDTINSNDLINKWDCNIQRSPEGETFATWHSGDCTPKFQADKMRLTFRYKVYTIGRSRCDPTSGAIAGGSTPRSTSTSSRYRS